MRLLLAANNQATRRNEIIKSYLQLGSSSNRYAPRLPQQETKSSTKQLPPTDPILGPENLLKTGFAQKGLPSNPPGHAQEPHERYRCKTTTKPTAATHQPPATETALEGAQEPSKTLGLGASARCISSMGIFFTFLTKQ